MKSFKRKSLLTHPRLLFRRLLSCWPFAVWLAIIVAVFFLHTATVRFGGMVGVVETISEPVAPLATARLLEITVKPGDAVKAGQVVARMDTSLLEAELAISEASLAEAESTISGYQQNILTLVRQVETSIKESESQLALIDVDEERDIAELEALKIELKRQEDLLKKKLVGELQVNSLRPRIASLERAVAGYPGLRDIHSARLEAARKERAEMNVWLRLEEGDDVSSAIRTKMEARMSIFESNRKLLDLQRRNYELRASRDGTVSTILRTPGDVVAAGDPVVKLVAEDSRRVVGFLPETHLKSIAVGQGATVWRQNGQTREASAVVAAITPEVMGLPGRISPIRGSPLRGRKIFLRLTGEHDFVPGETVQLSLGRISRKTDQ